MYISIDNKNRIISVKGDGCYRVSTDIYIDNNLYQTDKFVGALYDDNTNSVIFDEEWDSLYKPKINTEPEKTSIQKYEINLIEKTKDILDTKAKEYGYDNILSAVSYSNSTNIIYKIEGIAFIEWRDKLWNDIFTHIETVKLDESLILTDTNGLFEDFPLDLNKDYLNT